MKKTISITFLPIAAIFLILFSGCNLNLSNTPSYVPSESYTIDTENNVTQETSSQTATTPDDIVLSPSELFTDENLTEIVNYILYDFSEYGMNKSENLDKNNSDWICLYTSHYDNAEMSVNEFTKIVSGYFYEEIKSMLEDKNSEENTAPDYEEYNADGEYEESNHISDLDFYRYDFNCYFQQVDNNYEIYFCYA